MLYDNAGLTFYLLQALFHKLNLVFAAHLTCKSVTQICSSQDEKSSALLSKYSCLLSGSFAHTLPEQFSNQDKSGSKV